MNHDPESGTGSQRQPDPGQEKHGQTGPGKDPVNPSKPGGPQQPQQPGTGNRGNEGQRQYRPGEQKQPGSQDPNTGRPDRDDDDKNTRDQKQRGSGMP